MEGIFIDQIKRTNVKVLYNQEHVVEVLDGLRPSRETFKLVLERTDMMSCFVSFAYDGFSPENRLTWNPNLFI